MSYYLKSYYHKWKLYNIALSSPLLYTKDTAGELLAAESQNLRSELLMNKLLTAGNQRALDMLKLEIAEELGVQLGADATARQNGSVGGQMTKRLIEMAQAQLNQ